MQAVLLALMALSADTTVYTEQAVAENAACGCENGCGNHGHGLLGHRDRYHSGWWGKMPQTCYAPRYGCYPGNNRHMQRYPAFDGSYYRNPYSYRHLFEYPWHAEPHEPTSMFSYNVEEEIQGDSTLPPLPPTSAGFYRGASAEQPQKAAKTDVTLRPVSMKKTTNVLRSQVVRQR